MRLFGRGVQVRELAIVVPCCDQNVRGGDGQDVEEGEEVRGGEDEVALRGDFLRVGGDGDGTVGGGWVGGGDVAEGAVDGVVFF